MGTPLGPKYIPYTYMDPLGTLSGPLDFFNAVSGAWCLRSPTELQNHDNPKGSCRYIIYTEAPYVSTIYLHRPFGIADNHLHTYRVQGGMAEQEVIKPLSRIQYPKGPITQ